MDTNDSLGIQILKGVMLIVILAAIIFFSAGSLDWPEAWIFLGFYLAVIIALVIWLGKKDPALLKERSTARRKEDVKPWDKLIMQFFSSLFLVTVIVAGFDAVRFGWTKVPLVLEIAAYVAFIPSGYLIYRTMAENTFLSEMVRIQEERGHRVCTTGPYRVVRHPMYVGIIVFLLFFPLALGSFYALIPALVSVILLVLRTSLEDKTLQRELPGYKEYVAKVRYKLIPGVW